MGSWVGAPEGRRTVARGASPWFMYQGLAPLATVRRPSGAQDLGSGCSSTAWV
jgi:hypothetical protein